MLDKAAAQQRAMQFIIERWPYSDDEPVILERATIERDFGWAFHFQSRLASSAMGLSSSTGTMAVFVSAAQVHRPSIISQDTPR